MELWGALSLEPFGGMEYGPGPWWLFRYAVSLHLFAESPMGFHRTLPFNEPPFRALQINILSKNKDSAIYTNVK